MKRTLATLLITTGLLAPLATAAPASATNGGGHAGRTTQAPATNGGGHAGRAPSTNGGGHAGRTTCVDTDREGTTYVALPAYASPGGSQSGTVPANGYFDFCNNTATPTSNALWVYGEYLSGGHWNHGWVDENKLKGIHTIA